MIDINTALPLYIRPITYGQDDEIIGLLEMTSLRGLDGLNSKAEGHKKNSGRNIRDESVIDNFIKLLSRGLVDIDEREVFIGRETIFRFDLDFNSREKSVVTEQSRVQIRSSHLHTGAQSRVSMREASSPQNESANMSQQE